MIKTKIKKLNDDAKAGGNKANYVCFNGKKKHKKQRACFVATEQPPLLSRIPLCNI